MNRQLQKLMLSECRCATYQPAENAGGQNSVSDDALVKAVTVNENLLTLGYTLKPADIARLACSPSLETFYDKVSGLMEEVKAAPMYPDFPTQVMEMSEAQFRFHQMLHYLSTYGLEELFGEEVRRGWLPDEGTVKTEKDTALLKAKTLELLDERGAAAVLARRILQRRERMTLPEVELVRLALEEIAPEELARFEIPFKENLYHIFTAVIGSCSKEQAFDILRALCKHTGDVLKCTAFLLKNCKYHLRTSQKRFLVKLLEDYPVEDFAANLLLSLKKARKSSLVLKHLDYNLYSHSDGHREAARALRDGELHSWEGQARRMLEEHADGALDFAAARPGMLLRMTAWMLHLGYPAEEIREKLIASADVLSAQTLVSVLTFFGDPTAAPWKGEEREDVYQMFKTVLQTKMERSRTPLQGKKVFINTEGYELGYSVLNCNEKSAEGGYVRSGIAYKIPDNVQRLRFFVYWNDKERVDVDLHVSAHMKDGEDIRVGWNTDYQKSGIVSSGDITHSDAAEYIDMDLQSGIVGIGANINLYYGKSSFGKIETCFVGMMAVDKLGKKVKQYNPANCFFAHELKSGCKRMNYGYVDVLHRYVVFEGRESSGGYYDYKQPARNRFNLKSYLDCLLKAQNAEIVQTPEEAEIVLKLGKAEEEKDVSLIDNNFFL